MNIFGRIQDAKSRFKVGIEKRKEDYLVNENRRLEAEAEAKQRSAVQARKNLALKQRIARSDELTERAGPSRFKQFASGLQRLQSASKKRRNRLGTRLGSRALNMGMNYPYKTIDWRR